MGRQLGLRSLQFLDRLTKARLFSKVGTPLDACYTRVSSWSEAMRVYLDDEQDDVSTQSANAIRDQLPWEIYNALWNVHADLARETFPPEIDRLMQEALLEGRIPQELYEKRNYGVYWDIVHYVIECEFAEFIVPGIYAEKADLYLRGFFPCGWDGEYPEGRHIVF